MTTNKIKVLNLYAGIGGNRKLWDNVEVTAIEYKEEIASIYKDFFPQDNVIVTNAHEHLLKHFAEYDFIWASPPCPSHSRARKLLAWKTNKQGERWLQNEPIYPDMKLYQEIIFLDNHFEGLWVVENVISYYEPLIKPQELGSHYFWANFMIGKLKTESRMHDAEVEDLQKRKGFDLSKYKTETEKKLILRNCVEPELGLHIFKSAFKTIQTNLGDSAQLSLAVSSPQAVQNR